MKPITFPTLEGQGGAVHVKPCEDGGGFDAWLDCEPGFEHSGMIIGSGSTIREALGAAYQFLQAAAAAVMVAR